MVTKERMHTICRKLVKPSWGKSAREVDECTEKQLRLFIGFGCSIRRKLRL